MIPPLPPRAASAVGKRALENCRIFGEFFSSFLPPFFCFVSFCSCFCFPSGILIKMYRSLAQNDIFPRGNGMAPDRCVTRHVTRRDIDHSTADLSLIFAKDRRAEMKVRLPVTIASSRFDPVRIHAAIDKPFPKDSLRNARQSICAKERIPVELYKSPSR